MTDRQAWRAAIHGVTESQTQLSDQTELTDWMPCTPKDGTNTISASRMSLWEAGRRVRKMMKGPQGPDWQKEVLRSQVSPQRSLHFHDLPRKPRKYPNRKRNPLSNFPRKEAW